MVMRSVGLKKGKSNRARQTARGAELSGQVAQPDAQVAQSSTEHQDRVMELERILGIEGNEASLTVRFRMISYTLFAELGVLAKKVPKRDGQ